MNTTFQIGQAVKATTTAQGMVAGAIYKVTNVIADQTPWGNFVTYILVGAGSNDGLLQVRNGHLLLSEV